MPLTLIDAVLIEARCSTVGELQYISDDKKRKLGQKIDDLISADTVPLEHWNLLLSSLVNEGPEETDQAAKDKLVRLLQPENQTDTP